MSAAQTERQFRGVENSPPATDEQKAAVAEIRRAIRAAATAIDEAPLERTYRQRALDELEVVGMLAVKGVFAL